MNVGMLWFDNDPKAGLDAKVERAAVYYRKKYGKVPTLCFVHPTMMEAAEGRPKNGGAVEETVLGEAGAGENRYVSGGVTICTHHSVLPNHFWIGVNGINKAQTDLR